MDLTKLLNQPYFKDPLLLLRIWLGIAFISHGTPGIFNADYMAGFAGYMETIDMPMPTLMAYLSQGAELFAGILLLLGLFTRFAALMIIVDMLFATFMAMRGDIFGDFQAEISFVYLIIAIALFLNGATSYSMDRKFWAK